MKKYLLFIFIISSCYASDAPLYGTADNPEINGVAYDIHKTFIEPNAASPVTQNGNQNSAPVTNKPKQIIVTQDNSIQSDDWAKDSRVEKILKQAADGGKLSYVLAQTKKANLPASVAIIPIVESHYNKKAISPKGAGGAWQLMPRTANDYGLSSNDRFDFESSTKAAVQIFNDLYKVFGNWALVFAAYNCGERCVLTALQNNPNATNIDELDLPQETKQYVHKIVKLNQLIAALDQNNKH